TFAGYFGGQGAAAHRYFRPLAGRLLGRQDFCGVLVRLQEVNHQGNGNALPIFLVLPKRGTMQVGRNDRGKESARGNEPCKAIPIGIRYCRTESVSPPHGWTKARDEDPGDGQAVSAVLR